MAGELLKARYLFQQNDAHVGEKVYPDYPISSSVFLKGGANRLKPSEWQEIAEQVEKMLDTLQFGSITLVIQDGKVVQIEKNEKVRLQTNKKR